MYLRRPAVGSRFLARGGFVFAVLTLLFARFAAATSPRGCGHGTSDALRGQGCVCDAHWQQSKPSDPFNFALHECEQFMCESDAQCVDLLGIQDAKCPVQGWNCDCGLSHAAFENDRAKCMYPWYAGAMKAKHFGYLLLVNAWKVFALGALLMLPFGQNTIGPQDEYSCNIFYEDLAWTFWIVKIGVWTYLVIIAFYLQIAIVWVSVFAFAVTISMFLVAVCAAIGCVGGDSSGGFELGSQCDTPCGNCCESNPCDGCCQPSCCDGILYPSPLDNIDLQGFHPQQLYASSSDQIAYRKACNVCPLLKCLIPIFPKAPRNMLGGCVGHCMGTHSMADPEYYSSSWLQQCMSTSCFHLQRRGDAWRQFVQGFVLETDADEAMRQAGHSDRPARPQLGADGVILIGGVVVEPQEGDFLSSSLLIYNASDYHENCCWICCEPRGKFDLWLTCRHIFCSQCSTEMLRRRMPCPLCRVHTTKVLRRGSPDGGGASSGDELLRRAPEASPNGHRGLRQQAAPQQYTSVQQLNQQPIPPAYQSPDPSQQLLQQPAYASMGNVSFSERGLRRTASPQQLLQHPAYATGDANIQETGLQRSASQQLPGVSGALMSGVPRSTTGPPVLSAMQRPPPSAGIPYVSRPATQ